MSTRMRTQRPRNHSEAGFSTAAAVIALGVIVLGLGWHAVLPTLIGTSATVTRSAAAGGCETVRVWVPDRSGINTADASAVFAYAARQGEQPWGTACGAAK